MLREALRDDGFSEHDALIRMEAPNMSTIHSHTGVTLHLDNGVTVSIQWGPNTCASRHLVEAGAWLTGNPLSHRGSEQTWLTLEGFADPAGYLAEDDVARFIDAAASYRGFDVDGNWHSPTCGTVPLRS